MFMVLPPALQRDNARFERAAGAYVLLHNGELVGFCPVDNNSFIPIPPTMRLCKKSRSRASLKVSIVSLPLNRTVVHLEKLTALLPPIGSTLVYVDKFLGVHVAPSGLMIRLGPARRTTPCLKAIPSTEQHRMQHTIYSTMSSPTVRPASRRSTPSWSLANVLRKQKV